MATIGTIKEITVEDGQTVCIVDTGSGPGTKCNVGELSGSDCTPIVGDQVLYAAAGSEHVITAVLVDVNRSGSGESYFFGRDAAGVVVSEVKLRNDGTVVVNGDADAAALASKVDKFIDLVDLALSSWTVAGTDGGLALQTYYNAQKLIAYPPTFTPTPTASETLKVDK